MYDVSDWNLLRIEELFTKKKIHQIIIVFRYFKKALEIFWPCVPVCIEKRRSGAKWLQRKAEQKVFTCHVLGQQFSQEKSSIFFFLRCSLFFLLSTIILTSTFRANVLYIQTLSTYPTLEGKVWKSSRKMGLSWVLYFLTFVIRFRNFS